MSRCPKCGSYVISGPRYDSGQDRLRYTCTTCGYDETGPTREQHEREEALRRAERQGAA